MNFFSEQKFDFFYWRCPLFTIYIHLPLITFTPFYGFYDMQVNFVSSVRVQVNPYEVERAMRVEVYPAFVAMFGREGERVFRSSHEEGPPKSYHILDTDDVSDPSLIEDPPHCDVFYFLCDKDAPYSISKGMTEGASVVDYMITILSNLEKSTLEPEHLPQRKSTKEEDKSSSGRRMKVPRICKFSKEDFFRHLVINFCVPTFLALLKADDEVVDDSKSFDAERMLRSPCKSESTDLWVSWRLSIRKPIYVGTSTS